jgi:hypothetical protein
MILISYAELMLPVLLFDRVAFNPDETVTEIRHIFEV